MWQGLITQDTENWHGTSPTRTVARHIARQKMSRGTGQTPENPSTGRRKIKPLTRKRQTQKHNHPYGLVLVDGGPIESNRGQVTYETDWITMKVLRGHTEEIQFHLTSLQTYQVVLGAPWLRQHNPQIDWIRERITLNQCQCGSDRRAPKGNPIFPTLDELCTTESEQTEDLTQASVLKNRLGTR